MADIGLSCGPSSSSAPSTYSLGHCIQDRKTFVNVSHLYWKHGHQVLEAAEYLGVHEETIRQWAREGAIPAAKLGNRGGFRFKREDLERFLEERRTDRP